ncbi:MULTISPECIES: hypothetical protein [Providencia]|uniref:hypothetical protein n=1 Tax=Providencia TaxID=586 RepID=UPI0015D56C87|nr:hypothetical protein [Providencia rettgeri]MDH2376553.1 hypothetical protein [Providencia rettgeri]QLI97472.1 hypothetical protein H0A34_10860 [Providencia rettgeri]
MDNSQASSTYKRLYQQYENFISQASSTYKRLYQQYENFIAAIDNNKLLQNEDIKLWLKEIRAYIFDLYPVENVLHRDIENDIKNFGSETQTKTIQLACATLKKAHEDYTFQ